MAAIGRTFALSLLPQAANAQMQPLLLAARWQSLTVRSHANRGGKRRMRIKSS